MQCTSTSIFGPHYFDVIAHLVSPELFSFCALPYEVQRSKVDLTSQDEMVKS